MNQDLVSGNAAAGDGLSRPDRLAVLAFLSDPASEQVLRDGLGDLVANGIDIRRGNIKAAIAAMAKLQSPEVLIVDVSGEASPLRALGELSGVVEPGVRVLVIGETDDVDFYRQITRAFGVAEYIFKPITREAVARHFMPLITRKVLGEDATRGGRVIAMMGTRGGVGATTIAGNVAWYLGMSGKRHTVFVDADLHMGSGALLLGGKAGPDLRLALENPDQIDAAFIDHAVQPVADRLHVLAGDENLQAPLRYIPGSARLLIEALRVRYNFIVLDLPFLPIPSHRELLSLAHHRVVVMDPTLASVRDALRLLALPNGPMQPQSPTLVLNRCGRPGGLTRKQIEAALKAKIDVVFPDIPKQLNEFVGHGEPAVSHRGPFRQAIADLSRQIGFVGVDDEIAGPALSNVALTGLFKKNGLLKKVVQLRG
jgi:pilus assembly protein CpaE